MSFVVLTVGRVIHLISHVSFRQRCMCRRESGLAFFRQERHDFKRTERLMEARLNRALNDMHILIHAYAVFHICGYCLTQFLMRFESTATLMHIQLIILNESHTAFHKWYGLCPQLIFFIWIYVAVLAWKPSVGWNVVSTMKCVWLQGCLGNVVQMHVCEVCFFMASFKRKEAFCIFFFSQPIITGWPVVLPVAQQPNIFCLAFGLFVWIC